VTGAWGAVPEAWVTVGGTEIEEMRDWRKLEGSVDALVPDWRWLERAGTEAVVEGLWGNPGRMLARGSFLWLS